MCVRENMTIHAIAKQLTLEGVPTKNQTGNNIVTIKYPKLWHKNTIHLILKNKTYIGQWLYGKRKIEKLDTPGRVIHRATRRDDSEAIMVPVPPIVDRHLWEDAQKVLMQRRERGYKPTRWHYLLRGRIRCAKCGALFYGNTATRKKGQQQWQYYRCRKGLRITATFVANLAL